MINFRTQIYEQALCLAGLFWAQNEWIAENESKFYDYSILV